MNGEGGGGGGGGRGRGGGAGGGGGDASKPLPPLFFKTTIVSSIANTFFKSS